MISDRFEDFSQSLRILIEQKMRFQQLFLIDKDEAVGNLELAMKGVLDSFHSFYDAVRQIDTIDFDFYSHPLCCAVLAIRNAKHHNKANGIRSAHKIAQGNGRQDFLVVDFPAGQGEIGGSFIDHYVSWGDFDMFLSLPPTESRLREGTKDLVKSRIHASLFEEFAESNNVPIRSVFVNIVPIVIGAGSEFMPQLSNYIEPVTTEAKHFAWHFMNIEQADFQNPEFTELGSPLFG